MLLLSVKGSHRKCYRFRLGLPAAFFFAAGRVAFFAGFFAAFRAAGLPGGWAAFFLGFLGVVFCLTLAFSLAFGFVLAFATGFGFGLARGGRGGAGDVLGWSGSGGDSSLAISSESSRISPEVLLWSSLVSSGEVSTSKNSSSSLLMLISLFRRPLSLWPLLATHNIASVQQRNERTLTVEHKSAAKILAMPATRIKASVLGLTAAFAFTVLAGIQLDRQGVYYDELHQAPAAFHYLGRDSQQFNNYAIFGTPILNMTYSGSIKSNIYGLYLKFVNPRFSVRSWRLLGIVFVALGLFIFYQMAGISLPVTASVLFGALVMTDVSILLMTRHDWGPVALALCLRLAFLGAWLSIELSDAADWKHFAAGLIVGVAVFEKLSSVVLLIPFGILMLASRRRTWSACIAGFLGLLTGSLPLLLVNAASVAKGRGFISLTDLSGGGSPNHLREVFAYGYQYLALGQGAEVRQFILGDSSSPLWRQLEALVMFGVLLGIAVGAFRLRHTNRLMFLAGCMVASYALVGISLFMLPQVTSVHHWVLGTPFQYIAIALALFALGKHTLSRAALFLAVAVLLVARIPSFFGTESSLAYGRASGAFDPVFTRIAEIAARRSKESAFIAADWGTATQIYCLGNGQDDLVYEPFWGSDPVKALQGITQNTRKATLYIVVTGLGSQFLESSESIIRAMANSPNWQEVPIENEMKYLPPMSVRKFVRKPASS